MLGYTLRRLLVVIPVLWAIATITFVLMHAIPGGPFQGDKDRPEEVERNLQARYNFDEPLWKQYSLYLWNVSHGDLGISIEGDREVSGELKNRGFVSAQIAVIAVLFAVAVGLPLGVLSALNHNGPFDYLGVALATVGASVPHFVLALFLVIVFAVNLEWFGVLGWGGPKEWSDALKTSEYDWKTMIIPPIALGALPAAFIARVTRASMLEVLNQDYIRTARAKGLRESRVVLRHSIRNALIPVLTVVGPLSADLLAGSFIIENMFGIPGIGQWSIDAINARDYGVIMGTVLLYCFLITMANLIVDLTYAAVDPRIRYR